jgi:transcriptional regulator with GAF, ATPase, and Fis domain
MSQRSALPELAPLSEGVRFYDAVGRFERQLIEGALRRTGGVQKHAAELLGLKPTTLNEKIKRLGIVV